MIGGEQIGEGVLNHTFSQPGVQSVTGWITTSDSAWGGENTAELDVVEIQGVSPTKTLSEVPVTFTGQTYPAGYENNIIWEGEHSGANFTKSFGFIGQDCLNLQLKIDGVSGLHMKTKINIMDIIKKRVNVQNEQSAVAVYEVKGSGTLDEVKFVAPGGINTVKTNVSGEINFTYDQNKFSVLQPNNLVARAQIAEGPFKEEIIVGEKNVELKNAESLIKGFWPIQGAGLMIFPQKLIINTVLIDYNVPKTMGSKTKAIKMAFASLDITIASEAEVRFDVVWNPKFRVKSGAGVLYNGGLQGTNCLATNPAICQHKLFEPMWHSVSPFTGRLKTRLGELALDGFISIPGVFRGGEITIDY